MIDIAIYIISYCIAILIGSLVVERILSKYPVPDTGLKDAGKTIGRLKRTLILTFALLGEFVAIPFILAAKSIARFEELKGREFSEYYLIGTLTSILLAVIMGLVTKWVVGFV